MAVGKVGNLLDLPAVHRAIQSLDEREIIEVANAAAGAESGGWLARARAIGELQRRAGYKDSAVVKYAKALGIGKTLAFELGAIDKRILLPRLLEEGDAATFPIRQKLFYTVALRCAPQAKRSPLSILAMAEAARAKDRRFTVRKLQEQLGVHSTKDATHGIAACLERVAALSCQDRKRLARTAKDPAELLRLAEATAKSAHLLADELRAQIGDAKS